MFDPYAAYHTTGVEDGTQLSGCARQACGMEGAMVSALSLMWQKVAAI
ncbi:hypothetical protein ABZ747_18150 [Kitasatospora cineracea]